MLHNYCYQITFKPGNDKFNVLSENVDYLFLFESPRNSSKIIHLAKQFGFCDNSFIVQSFRESTYKEFTYLWFDSYQCTPETIRIRSKIFLGTYLSKCSVMISNIKVFF